MFLFRPFSNRVLSASKSSIDDRGFVGGTARRVIKQLSFKQLSKVVIAASFVMAGFAQAAPEVGGTYYTQYNLWSEKGKSVATNYARGELTPFNTKASLVSIDKKKVVIDVDGRQIQLINKPKFTQRGTTELADELLKPSPVDLSNVSADRQSDMRNGILRLGMSKPQTIVTRGYPPRHETPSIEANRWIYWSSRFVKLTLVFDKGVLSQGRGLY